MQVLLQFYLQWFCMHFGTTPNARAIIRATGWCYVGYKWNEKALLL